MEILIIAHYGQQPPKNTMRRYHNWGKELVNRGNKVTIIAASALHNTNIDFIDELGSDHSVCNGIDRIKNMLLFCMGIRKYSSLKPDAILICGAYLYGFTKRAFQNVSVITDTVDLWPESIVEYADFSKSNPLIKYLYHIEKKAYLKSDALIFSMEGGVDYVKEQAYANRIDFSKIFHINMGCDVLQKDRELEGVHVDLGWNPDEFNVVYCGR